MMKAIEVGCTFAVDGAVRVRRVRIDGRWLNVSQGRQWMGEDGRHILIMLPDNQIRELLLHSENLIWHLLPARSSTQIA